MAGELVKHGRKLHYYDQKSRNELDFLMHGGNGILIVEVKSGSDFKKHTALNNVLELARNSTNLNIEQSFVFCKSNVEKVEKIVYAPLYMAAFL